MMVLSVMQVGFQAKDADESSKEKMGPFAISVIRFMISLLSIMLLRESVFTAKDIVRRKRDDARASSAETTFT